MNLKLTLCTYALRSTGLRVGDYVKITSNGRPGDITSKRPELMGAIGKVVVAPMHPATWVTLSIERLADGSMSEATDNEGCAMTDRSQQQLVLKLRTTQLKKMSARDVKRTFIKHSFNAIRELTPEANIAAIALQWDHMHMQTVAESDLAESVTCDSNSEVASDPVIMSSPMSYNSFNSESSLPPVQGLQHEQQGIGKRRLANLVPMISLRLQAVQLRLTTYLAPKRWQVALHAGLEIAMAALETLHHHLNINAGTSSELNVVQNIRRIFSSLYLTLPPEVTANRPEMQTVFQAEALLDELLLAGHGHSNGSQTQQLQHHSHSATMDLVSLDPHHLEAELSLRQL